MAEEEGENQEFERRLQRAVCDRLQHLKDQADSLTLESVRRLLEKDLELEEFSLDAHKRFIRFYLEKKMESAGDCESETSTENVDKDIHLSKEAEMDPKQNETKIDPKKSSTGDEEIMEDSPIMGVLTLKSDAENQESSISEGSIEKAIWDRADHFQANSENITLGGVRRLLEEDLGLGKNSLDPFKKFISEQIDQVFASLKEDNNVKDVKKKVSDNLKAKKPKKVSSEESSNSAHSESDEIEVNPRKKAASKRNIASKSSEQSKKRKISEVKQNKSAKRQKQEENNNDEDGSLSEDDQSHSSVEKTAQRKEKPASGHGKRAENLKSIIKACGMSVAPSIYKKAKQVPEEKREAFIVKELEDILSREGLSKNPTEKEIKDCRKRKDRAKELEGIDMSNIISSSRRRSTFSFASPVTPEVRAKKDKIVAKDSKSKAKDKDKNHKDDDEEEDSEKMEDGKEDVKEEDKNEKEDEEQKKEKDGEEEEVEEEDEEEEEEEDDEDDESEEFNEDDSDESD